MHYYRIYCIIYTLKPQLIVNRNTTQLKTLPQPNPKHLNASTRNLPQKPNPPRHHLQQSTPSVLLDDGNGVQLAVVELLG